LSRTNDITSATFVNSKNDISNEEWRHALNEAKSQLLPAKVRVAKLKAAIRLFTEKLKGAKSIPA
jgi:hypothetical protein